MTILVFKTCCNTSSEFSVYQVICVSSLPFFLIVLPPPHWLAPWWHKPLLFLSVLTNFISCREILEDMDGLCVSDGSLQSGYDHFCYGELWVFIGTLSYSPLLSHCPEGQRDLEERVLISYLGLLGSLITMHVTHFKRAHISIPLAKHEASLRICFLENLHCFIGICFVKWFRQLNHFVVLLIYWAASIANLFCKCRFKVASVSLRRLQV